MMLGPWLTTRIKLQARGEDVMFARLAICIELLAKGCARCVNRSINLATERVVTDSDTWFLIYIRRVADG